MLWEASPPSETAIDACVHNVMGSRFLQHYNSRRLPLLRKQISKKDFLFYVENVDEIKHLNHGRESARPAPQPDDSPPVIPTRIPRPKVPPTHDQKTEPELTGSENSALEVIKNEDGESENETMEEVMRKLRETDVAIHAVHTVTTTPTGGDDNDIES